MSIIRIRSVYRDAVRYNASVTDARIYFRQRAEFPYISLVFFFNGWRTADFLDGDPIEDLFRTKRLSVNLNNARFSAEAGLVKRVRRMPSFPSSLFSLLSRIHSSIGHRETHTVFATATFDSRCHICESLSMIISELNLGE